MDSRARMDQIRSLQQEYEQRDREESRLREEFAEIRARFDQQFATLGAQKQALRIQQSSLAPIYTLCDDVMSYIIELACHEDHAICWKKLFKQHDTADYQFRNNIRSLSRVSRRFRTFVFGSPRLWQCVHIGNEKVSAFTVEDYLQRSKGLPLCVMVDTVERSGAPRYGFPHIVEASYRDKNGVIFHHKWDVVRAEMHRWKYLSLNARDDGRLEPLIRTADYNLPMLEGLQVSDYRGSDEQSFFSPKRVLLLPKLSMLRASKVDSFHDRGFLTNLTVLRFVASTNGLLVEGEEWYNALKAMPKLEMLSVHEIYNESEGQPSASPRSVLLPRLHHLELQHLEVGTEFPSISAPSLRTLHLLCITMPSINSMLSTTNGFPHVSDLLIDTIFDVTSDQMEVLLSLTPNVTSAELLGNRVLDSICSNGSLLPRLESLAATPTGKLPIVRRYLQARADAGRPLKIFKANCDFWEGVEFDDLDDSVTVDWVYNELPEDPFVEALWHEDSFDVNQ